MVRSEVTYGECSQDSEMKSYTQGARNFPIRKLIVQKFEVKHTWQMQKRKKASQVAASETLGFMARSRAPIDARRNGVRLSGARRQSVASRLKVTDSETKQNNPLEEGSSSGADIHYSVFSGKRVRLVSSGSDRESLRDVEVSLRHYKS